jgi:hypothetical protein
MTEKDIRKLIREAINELEEARMVTYAYEIMSQFSKNVPGIKTIDFQAMGDGMIGLYRYKDGNAYEIQIRPAGLSKNKERWGKLVKKNEPHPMKTIYRQLGQNPEK